MFQIILQLAEITKMIMSHSKLTKRSHITLLASIGSDSVVQILSFYKHPRRITNQWQTRQKKNVLNCFSVKMCSALSFCFVSLILSSLCCVGMISFDIFVQGWPSTLVSYGYHYKFPQTRWFKTTDAYYLIVMQARSLKFSLSSIFQ